jgi:hypothetical protein
LQDLLRNTKSTGSNTATLISNSTRAAKPGGIPTQGSTFRTNNSNPGFFQQATEVID